MPTFVIDSLKSVLLFVIELLLVRYVLQGYSEILFSFSFFH